MYKSLGFILQRTANFGLNLGMNLSSHWARGSDLLEVVNIPKVSLAEATQESVSRSPEGVGKRSQIL